jgi:hypothetical protein
MNARDRRALVVGGLIVGVAVLALRVVPRAVATLGREWTALEQSARLLAQSRAEVQGAATLDDTAAVLEQEVLALAPAILTGGTEAEAVADLVHRLTVLTQDRSALIERTDHVPDSLRAGALRRVVVRFTLRADSEGLFDLVREIEGGTVVLPIRHLRVLAPEPLAPATMPERLRAELTVQGWYVAQEET